MQQGFENSRGVRLFYFDGTIEIIKPGKVLIDYLFKVVGLNKVMAETGDFNQGSIALLRASRFQQDGCLRQHQLFKGVLHDRLLFSLLAQDLEI